DAVHGEGSASGPASSSHPPMQSAPTNTATAKTTRATTAGPLPEAMYSSSSSAIRLWEAMGIWKRHQLQKPAAKCVRHCRRPLVRYLTHETISHRVGRRLLRRPDRSCTGPG